MALDEPINIKRIPAPAVTVGVSNSKPRPNRLCIYTRTYARKTAESLSAEKVVDLARKGNVAVLTAFDQLGYWLGIWLAYLTNTLNIKYCDYWRRSVGKFRSAAAGSSTGRHWLRIVDLSGKAVFIVFLS